MNLDTTAYILAAVVIATGIHAFMEPFNLRKQLLVLKDLINGGKEPPAGKVNIKPNPVGSALIVSIIMAIFAGASYAIISTIEPELERLLIFSAIFLVVVELTNTIAIDRIHAVISSMKDKYRK